MSGKQVSINLMWSLSGRLWISSLTCDWLLKDELLWAALLDGTGAEVLCSSPIDSHCRLYSGYCQQCLVYHHLKNEKKKFFLAKIVFLAKITM
jgi:hypothetical protein